MTELPLGTRLRGHAAHRGDVLPRGIYRFCLKFNSSDKFVTRAGPFRNLVTYVPNLVGLSKSLGGDITALIAVKPLGRGPTEPPR